MSSLPGSPVAVVTGAARGIGRASALALARRGYAVALSDRLAEALEATRDEVQALGVETLLLPGSVSDYQGVQAHGQKLLQHFGRVDVLVNNAGISQPKTLIEITEQEFDEVISINLKGYFAWCKAVAPAMLSQKRGRIINISSVSAHMGATPNAVSRFAYVTAKAGVLGLTRALCKELAPHVSVNAICPGSIETSLTEELFRARRKEVLETIPLGRLGTPEDIAEVVAFLATVNPNFITGEIIDVDGGQYVN